MFEYYGWLSLPLDGHNVEALSDYVDEIIRRTSSATRLSEAKIINAHYVLCFAGLPNRRSEIAQNVIDIFKSIADDYPTAYGALFTRDANIPGAQFRVLTVGQFGQL